MGKANQVERRYIRHPSRMPIRFDLQHDVDHHDEYLRNVSEGGLCFSSDVALDPGQSIRLTIPLLGKSHEIDGTVAWCRRSGGDYEVGVRFRSTQDRFSARMVEQLCYIEDYRQQVALEEGRRLSSEEAAKEWIERFAEHFPDLH
jgi:hypothetical protein